MAMRGKGGDVLVSRRGQGGYGVFLRNFSYHIVSLAFQPNSFCFEKTPAPPPVTFIVAPLKLGADQGNLLLVPNL